MSERLTRTGVLSTSLFLCGEETLQAQNPDVHPNIQDEIREQVSHVKSEMQQQSREQLIHLLNSPLYQQREAASLELIERGSKEIVATRSTPSWIQELKTERGSAEQKERVRKIFCHLELEESTLLWEGLRIPASAQFIVWGAPVEKHSIQDVFQRKECDMRIKNHTMDNWS